jgi:mersacidin/lichenicidin family type 2 lantibiotic
MSHLDIVRACKDPEYQQNLNEAERAHLPALPAGPIELKDAEIDAVSGGVTDGCIPRPGKPVQAWSPSIQLSTACDGD